MAGNDSTVRPSVLDLDLDELELCIRKALGVAMALSETAVGEHDRYAAEAIVDNLHEARKILEATPGPEGYEAREARLN